MNVREILLSVAEYVLGLVLPFAFYIRGLIERRLTKVVARRLIWKRIPKELSGWRPQPKDVVILHHPGRGPWVPSMIPFAVKLETYLRMAKIPYKSVHGLIPSPKKGKFPWIEYNGKAMGDTSLIIKFLNKKFNVDMSKHLNPEQKATARAFQTLAEEHTYWAGFCYRWWIYFDLTLMTEAMGIPSWIVTWYQSRKMQKLVWTQGMGRHSFDEIREMMRDDLGSISDMIGKKKFLMGDVPCEEDCAVFGILSQGRWNQPGSAERVRLLEEEYPNVRDYYDRMKDTFWPDWDECITHGGTRKPSK